MMSGIDRTDRYCVLGAGSSGLAVAKNFLQAGIAFDCLERNDDVGGNWYYGKPGSSVYRSTQLISSKRLTEYTDFPMPPDYPPYPSQQQAWEYLRSYARHFGLYERIEFNTAVQRVEPDGPHWLVTLENGERRQYRGVVIANGHNWDPRWPDVPGTFDGEMLHSCQYKTPDALRDRRVLVIGAGNSGCDIAVESALHAAVTFHSLRRGYHYIPKFIAGHPTDEVNEAMLRWRVPLAVRRLLARSLARIGMGWPEMYGLPKPDHKLFETHPIINSQLLYYVGHGRIRVKPNVAEWCGREVRFTDGSREAIDVVVCATGYKISFPFIDREHLNWRDGRPDLYLNVFHPTNDDLCVVGLIQPDSGQWGLVDRQAQLITRFYTARERDPARAERFRRRKADPARDRARQIRYVDSPRHLLEVEHFGYRRLLEKRIGEFS